MTPALACPPCAKPATSFWAKLADLGLRPTRGQHGDQAIQSDLPFLHLGACLFHLVPGRTFPRPLLRVGTASLLYLALSLVRTWRFPYRKPLEPMAFDA